MAETRLPYPALIILLSVVIAVHSATGPCSPPERTDGPFTVAIDTFLNSDRAKDLYLFAPAYDSTFPLLLFCSAFSARTADDYEELVTHLVSNGNNVLFVPARQLTFTRNRIVQYDLGLSGIFNAVHRSKTIDTTRIGIIGHGFGGGAAPALMKRLRSGNWGSNGALIYILSPWYLYSIEKRGLAAYPDNVNLVIQIFDNDRLNSPAIAADIFSLIGIPEHNKIFLLTGSIFQDECTILAGFSTPLGGRSASDQWDFLDLCGIIRPLDAAVAGTFTPDTALFSASVAASVADAGDSATVPHCVTVIDRPSLYRPRGIWINQWNSVRNPRIDANFIRKSRKTRVRHKAKKLAVASEYLTKKVRYSFTSSENDSTSEMNPIDSGFGANGPYTSQRKQFPNPRSDKDTVTVFHPSERKGPVPAIFFLHGYNNGNTDYFIHLINHIVSRGYALIFSPYPPFPSVDNEKSIMDKYYIAAEGITEAVKRFPQIIDSSRIGIFGQSFGAGAVPWLAKRVLTEKEWGENGAFLMISAPWYTYGITNDDLQNLPEQTKLLLITYDDDVFNDHQMAVDIFRATTSISDSEKCFVSMFSDTLDSLVLPANHFVPYSSRSINGVIDNFDFFGIFRLFDALAQYTFTGDTLARRIALGNGSPEQCFMGEWYDGTAVTPLTVSRNPLPRHSALTYLFSWDNRLNPRRDVVLPWRKNRNRSDRKGRIDRHSAP